MYHYNRMAKKNRKSRIPAVKSALVLMIAVFLSVWAPLAAAAATATTAAGAATEAEEVAATSADAATDIIPDPAGTGTITVTFRDASTGEPAQYGNKVALYKVADIEVEDGYRFVYDELFESVGDAPTRDAQLDADLALKLEETAELKGISFDTPSSEIDSEGVAKFADVETGLYLVTQTFRISASERFIIAPFLVMVPTRNADGTLNYDVESYPYTSNNVKKGSPDQLALLESDIKSLPNVGKKEWPLNSPVAAAAAAITGALFIAGGIAAGTKIRKKDRDQPFGHFRERPGSGTTAPAKRPGSDKTCMIDNHCI